MSRRNVERGAQSAGRSPPCVMRSPGGSPTPSAGAGWRGPDTGQAQRDSRLHGSKGRLMRFQVMRASAAALAMSVVLVGGASAQAPTKPANPAAPGQVAPAPQGQPQPPPPSKVDPVSPEPQWAKFCAKQPTNGKEACATMRDFSTSADQPPMISINLFDVAGEERRNTFSDPADRHAAEARLPGHHRQRRAD